MAIPERISLSLLTEAYAKMGFYPQPSNQLTFERKDGLMMFHVAYGMGEFYWTTVMEDIERTENLQGMEEGLGGQFFDALSELFEDSAQDN